MSSRQIVFISSFIVVDSDLRGSFSGFVEKVYFFSVDVGALLSLLVGCGRAKNMGAFLNMEGVEIAFYLAFDWGKGAKPNLKIVGAELLKIRGKYTFKITVCLNAKPPRHPYDRNIKAKAIKQSIFKREAT